MGSYLRTVALSVALALAAGAAQAQKWTPSNWGETHDNVIVIGAGFSQITIDFNDFASMMVLSGSPCNADPCVFTGTRSLVPAHYFFGGPTFGADAAWTPRFIDESDLAHAFSDASPQAAPPNTSFTLCSESGVTILSCTFARIALAAVRDATVLTAGQTAPASDLVGIDDVSAGVMKSVVPNVLVQDVVDGATEDTTPDATADYLLTKDTSASGLKKVKPESFAFGRKFAVSNSTTQMTAASTEKAMIVWAIPAGLLKANGVITLVSNGERIQNNATAGATTMKVYIGGASGGCTAAATCTGGPAGSTLIYNSSADSNPAQNSVAHPVWMDITFQAINSTSSQRGWMNYNEGNAGGTTTNGNGDTDAATESSARRLTFDASTIDMTSATDIVVTMFDTSATNTHTIYNWYAIVY